ncbi:hypothetical protein [Streptomyces sp. CAI-85]|uniref:hypothetical protein n=1 Tax=Streptomyces sp. CAI-85 TaxID=1472662 RepID=UPI0015876D1B|nr:hypothetical protein [Streptomyces sp. CAI-85]NUV63294.1 Rrf2 family transcriptional regulator [Streptomyces sp. CAI-85]
MEADGSGFEITQRQGAWVVRMWWPVGPVNGGPQRIIIESGEDAPAREVARGISTTVLRRLDVAAALELARQAPEARRTLEEAAGKLNGMGEAAGLALEGEGVSDRYLALLVATYTAMADSGTPAPIPWLARLIGRRPETVKDHLKRARRDGFLTTVAGKAGGELTGKARTALAELAEAGSQGD